MTENPQISGIINSLEQIRVGAVPMANGGSLRERIMDRIPARNNNNQDLVSALEKAKIYVSVVEVREGLNKVQVVESRASI
jgi:hypothetical protein